MNMKYWSLPALALSLSLSQGTVAFAEHMGCYNVSEGIHKVVDKLDLTADQKAKIKVIADKAKMDEKAKHDELQSIHTTITEAYKSNTMTASKIDDFISQEQPILGAMLKIRMMERMDIANVLTDAQKVKMSEIIEKWKAKHKDH